jgi:hypothetical protein
MRINYLYGNHIINIMIYYMMKLKDFAIVIRTIGIICLFVLLITTNITIPVYVIAMITIGYLCSAISCSAKLFSPSVKHHKIVNYFIALMGIVVIVKHYSSAL